MFDHWKGTFLRQAAIRYCQELARQLTEAVFSHHYDDVIMGAIASQITSLTIVYSTDYSGAYQSKHQSSASLAFVRGIHRRPVNSPHKWPVTRKTSPFDDVIMTVWSHQTGFTLNICKSNCEALDRGNYRGLKLTDQVIKVLGSYIRWILNIDKMQLVPSRGTTDVIFVVRQLQERSTSQLTNYSTTSTLRKPSIMCQGRSYGGP